MLVVCSSSMAVEWAQNIRVVWSEAPQTEAMVVWDSENTNTPSALVYDTVSRTDEKRSYAAFSSVTERGLYKDPPNKPRKKKDGTVVPPEEPAPELFYHHAMLENLKPGSVYYLAVKTPDGTGREYHFRTAPEDGAPFKLIFAGDSRTRIDVAREISEQMSEMVAADDSILALLHGGDYAGSPRRKFWKPWLEAYSLTTTSGGKLLPIIPVAGNHEGFANNPMYLQAYGYPGGEGGYYLCSLTPSVGILVLNSQVPDKEKQLEFLKQALGKMKQEKIQWQMVAYHRPLYPAVKEPGGDKESWVPVFEEFNLDLALESDGHCIKRTVPIRGEKESADGVVYLGEGGYGAPQRDPKTDRWFIQGEQAFASKGDHIMMLEITPKSINYSTVLSTGEVVDSAEFKPRRR